MNKNNRKNKQVKTSKNNSKAAKSKNSLIVKKTSFYQDQNILYDTIFAEWFLNDDDDL